MSVPDSLFHCFSFSGELLPFLNTKCREKTPKRKTSKIRYVLIVLNFVLEQGTLPCKVVYERSFHCVRLKVELSHCHFCPCFSALLSRHCRKQVVPYCMLTGNIASEGMQSRVAAGHLQWEIMSGVA